MNRFKQAWDHPLYQKYFVWVDVAILIVILGIIEYWVYS